MRLFLKKVLLFLAPLVIALLLLEIYLNSLPTLSGLKEKGLIANASHIELLILGNSHSTYGIDPNQFSIAAYNLAQLNQSLYFDKRITLKHLDELVHLKYVLISLDFHSFYFSSQGIRDVWSYYGNGIAYKNELPYASKISRIKGYTLKVVVSDLKKKFKQNENKINAIDIEDGVNLSIPINKGWISLEGTNEELMGEENCMTLANEFNDLVKNSKEKKEIIADLENFIQQLKIKNITPILLTPPCYWMYNKMLNQDLLHQNESEIIQLSQKFNIPYWNYFDLPLDKSNFYTCDHLNAKGASTFSKLLNQRLHELISDAGSIKDSCCSIINQTNNKQD